MCVCVCVNVTFVDVLVITGFYALKIKKLKLKVLENFCMECFNLLSKSKPLTVHRTKFR